MHVCVFSTVCLLFLCQGRVCVCGGGGGGGGGGGSRGLDGGEPLKIFGFSNIVLH